MKTTYKIRKGDPVVVITGKDKGKTGKVLAVQAGDGTVLVEGVNIVTKHQKPVAGNPGEIRKMEKPIHISNVMYYLESEKKGTKIGYAMEEKKKERVAKKTGKKI